MVDRPMKKGDNTVQDTELPSHGLLSLPILLTHGYVDITTTLHNTNHKLPHRIEGDPMKSWKHLTLRKTIRCPSTPTMLNTGFFKLFSTSYRGTCSSLGSRETFTFVASYSWCPGGVWTHKGGVERKKETA